MLGSQTVLGHRSAKTFLLKRASRKTFLCLIEIATGTGKSSSRREKFSGTGTVGNGNDQTVTGTRIGREPVFSRSRF